MSTPAVIDAPVDTNTPADAGFIDTIDAAFAGLDDIANDDIPDVVPNIDVNDEPAPVATGDEEVDPLDEVEVKDWTPEAASKFNELRTELKAERLAARELRETLEQREARLAELEASNSSPEVAELRQKIEEYETKLLVTKLEDTTAYKDLVETPLRAVVEQSDALATKYGIDPDDLFAALASTDEAAQEEQISELLASAAERDRFKAYQLIEQLKPIHAQREALQNNSKEALLEAQELETYRNQESLRQRAEERKVAVKQVADRVVAKLDFLKNIEGVDMAAVSREVEGTDHATLSPVKAAYNHIAAELFPKVAKEYLKMIKERDGLVTKLAAYAKSTPRVGGQGGPSLTADASLSFVDAINKQFGG